MEHSPTKSDQLDLWPVDTGRAGRVPWGGVSPRTLTKAFNSFSLGALPPGGLRGGQEKREVLQEKKESSSIQLELFLLYLRWR